MKLSPEHEQLLLGRSLLEEEIPFKETLPLYIQQKIVYQTPAMTKIKHRYRCNRCNEHSPQFILPYHCARCGQVCYYCRKCLQLGRVTSCSYLYVCPGQLVDIQETNEQYLDWAGQLSPGQEMASDRVVETIEKKSDLLIWAVCGAGKSEVIFAGINRALQLGQRIAIATPRTDVVHELTPRLKKVFPKNSLVSLYGGSDERMKFAQITITTTHQLLRFDQAFDVMIVDEVDAFPYSVDKMLQFAVKKAMKHDAAQIYLTATPDRQLQLQCKYNKTNYVKIPSRYHRHPLPLPTFYWCGNWRKSIQKNKLPKQLIQWVTQTLQNNHPILLFFPHIQLMEQALPLFQSSFTVKIASVHSQDEQRREKVQAMRDKNIHILLTTMILERGVTFPNVAVAVIGAEDATFTESALVQISGRVGRSAQFPTGPLAFFHFGRTKAMLYALNQMIQMNKEAKERGDLL